MQSRFGGLTGALAAIGLFVWFHSPLFLLSITLLALATLACTLNRWSSVWRQVVRRPEFLSDLAFEAAPDTARLSSGATADSPSVLCRSLEVRGFRVRYAAMHGWFEFVDHNNRQRGRWRLADRFKRLVQHRIRQQSHDSMAGNKYMFRVSVDSDKRKVKEAVENLYSVGVTKVTIVNIPRKKRVYGRTSGWKSGYKKATVTLKEGDKIELFKGV